MTRHEPHFPWCGQPHSGTSYGVPYHGHHEGDLVVMGEFKEPSTQPRAYGTSYGKTEPYKTNGSPYLRSLEDVRGRGGYERPAHPQAKTKGYGIKIEHPWMGGVLEECQDKYA